MAIVISRDRVQKASPKYSLPEKIPVTESAPDPVVSAIDRFGASMTEILRQNKIDSMETAGLLVNLTKELQAAKPKSWTFKARKDSAGNMTINATPNY